MIVLDALSSTASRKFFKRDVVVEIPGKNIPFRGEMSILLLIDIYTYTVHCTARGGLNVTGLGPVLSTKKGRL